MEMQTDSLARLTHQPSLYFIVIAVTIAAIGFTAISASSPVDTLFEETFMAKRRIRRVFSQRLYAS
ncbi:hypothetical protein BDV25DRAFT_156361 [Aspergillus avenaceus]|uniref:Uncharacterized protein n=1 Tax=Aspergillus avenaceus TaxID=36643 RepID=A0A5N6TSU8_ASPAV|nr:hypothetical protein BDV25DRAFT_156361 [Aspergillus avenaceus]